MVMLMIRVSEKLLQKFGYKIPMWLGALITAVGAFGLSLTMFTHDTYMLIVVIAFAVFGFGLGCYSTPAADCAMVNVPLDKAGIAAGIFKMASALGASFGIATAATVFSIYKSSTVHIAGQNALLVMATFGILASLVVWFMIPKDTH